MKRSSILAHRGWWDTPSAKNSAQALERALTAGFGIETDFRDLDGTVVVSHDPPLTHQNLRTAQWFAHLVLRTGNTGRLALNIKADGLQRSLLETFEAAGVPLAQVFAFDMSVPDTLGYLSAAMPVYARMSEYEDPPTFMDRAQGVWIDNFTGTFPQIAKAQAIMDQGLRAALVSPELHGRDYRPLWDDIFKTRLHENPLFELCTDFPQDAATRLGD